MRKASILQHEDKNLSPFTKMAVIRDSRKWQTKSFLYTLVALKKRNLFYFCFSLFVYFCKFCKKMADMVQNKPMILFVKPTNVYSLLHVSMKALKLLMSFEKQINNPMIVGYCLLIYFRIYLFKKLCRMLKKNHKTLCLALCLKNI